jgi:hypothetical protein
MSTNVRLRGLFLNTAKENCSIHESGQMVYSILKSYSEFYELEYLEIDANNPSVPGNFDFYLLNYHFSKMAWLNTSIVKNLPGKKFTVVLEILPGNPFAAVNESHFDGFLILDPTIKTKNAKCFPVVRPLELEIMPRPYVERAIPVIGSFGYPTPGKGFELLVDAVNREFSEAVIKINVPPVNSDTYQHCFNLYKTDYTDYIEKLCKSTAAPGIQVEFTRDFFTKEELINWCAANTLNCFMYNRFQTGLSATTDQAIVSGRPLAISSNETFRHIHQFIVPYPFRSLKESILRSSHEVERIKANWTSEAFRKVFVDMLFITGTKALGNTSNTATQLSMITNNDSQEQAILQRVVRKLKRTIKKVLRQTPDVTKSIEEPLHKYLLEIPEKDSFRENTILFVSHSSKKCGIHEFGLNFKEALKNSQVYHVCYTECANSDELFTSIQQTNPSVIIYNYYPTTMPWMTREVKERYLVPQLGFIHEFDQSNITDNIKESFFDSNICPDPSLQVESSGKCFVTGRLLAKYQNYTNLPSVVTVGSFGFGFPDKGFERLVETVQDEFDEAVININMPFNDIVDPNGTNFALATADTCRKILKKPGIKLNITHDYLSKGEILDFLARNTINVFLYNSDKSQGISSVLDYAISAQRPIAISSAKMFRHVGSIYDQISVEKNTLTSIIDRGLVPLIPFLNDWNESKTILTFERIIDVSLDKGSERSYDDYGKNGIGSRGKVPITESEFNIVLDNSVRKRYQSVIRDMFQMAPEMMNRKIHEANIQQAFVLNTVLLLANGAKDLRILSVGSFEDSAGACLKKLGFEIIEIDPAINYDLNEFFHLPTTNQGSFDIVFSTSVIEHVPDDNLFIKQISELLKPGGKAVLTCDFKPTYQVGENLPITDLRFYKYADLETRLLTNTKNCRFLTTPKWRDGNIDFFYSGIFNYSFASFVFEKGL